VHALASTAPESDAEKGAEHAEQVALPATDLYVPVAHKVQTPALPVAPAAHTATHTPLIVPGPTGPDSHTSGGAQKQSVMFVEAFARVVA